MSLNEYLSALVAFLLGFTLMLGFRGSFGQTHHHAGESADVDRFYSTWMMPDDQTKSCCHRLDCAPAEAKMMDGAWYARQVGAWKWNYIPPEKIEHNRDNPDGRNHLCASSGGSVYCFILGSGT